MQSILELGMNNENKLSIEKSRYLENQKSEFQRILQNIIDKGADYVIKASPLNDHVKDILIDVKEALKTNDFKEIIKTTINSSLREGMEILNIPKDIIRDITKLKDVIKKGGLISNITNSLDIFTKNKFKGNLYCNYIDGFVNDLKAYINSRTFSERLDSNIYKLKLKDLEFLSLCKEWERLYEDFNISGINEIAKKIDKFGKNLFISHDSIKNRDRIKNITELVNNKKSKLSQVELQICNSL